VAHTHTPGREFAKTAIVKVDGECAMLVLPAHLRDDLGRLRRCFNASQARPVTEEEMARLFPDCEIGAEPPFGNLYELPAYVSPLLSGDRITFHVVNNEEAVQMKFADFISLAKPSVIDVVGY
jgi:Ala-tRNA(Pro) deacylase